MLKIAPICGRFRNFSALGFAWNCTVAGTALKLELGNKMVIF